MPSDEIFLRAEKSRIIISMSRTLPSPGPSDRGVLILLGSTSPRALAPKRFVKPRLRYQMRLPNGRISSFSMDIASIPVIKEIQPSSCYRGSQSCGRPLFARPSPGEAGAGGGADGLLIEVHPSPKDALVDGRQSLTPCDVSRLMGELKPIAQALAREI